MRPVTVAERELFDATFTPLVLNPFTDYHGLIIGKPLITRAAHDAVAVAIFTKDATPQDIAGILTSV